jgi:hypothetical protein
MVSSRASKIKIILAVSIILVALVFSIPNVKAQTHIVINEFESNPPGEDTGNQWVELYNPTADAVSLDGWKLITINGLNITFLPGTTIFPGYYVASSPSLLLEHNNESIILRDSSNNEIDRTPIKSDTSDNSSAWARFPNGKDTDNDSDWVFQASTGGFSNGGLAHGQSSMQINVTNSGQGNAVLTYAGEDFENMNSRYQSMGDSSFKASVVNVCSQLGFLVPAANISTNINQSTKTMTVSMTATNFAQEIDSTTWRINSTLAKNVYSLWNQSGNTYSFTAPTDPELPFPHALSFQLPSKAVNIQFNPDTYILTYTIGFTVMLETVPADKGVIIFDGVNYNNGENILKANGSYSIGATSGSDYQFTRWETTGSISVTNPNLSSTMCTISGNGTLRMMQTSLTPTPPPSGRCVVATAAYGSELAPEVVYMRNVRDNMVGSNDAGRQLVSGWNTFYYSWSPPIARFIDTYGTAKPIFRVLLLPLVGTVHLTAIIYGTISLVNTSLASIVAFLIAALSSISIYVVCPLITIRLIYRKANSIH